MNRSWYWFLIFLIVSLIVSLLIISYKYKLVYRKIHSEHLRCLEEGDRLRRENKNLVEWIDLQSELWFSYCEELEILFRKKSSPSLQVSEQNANRLVYWFNNSRACEDCVTENIELLKQVVNINTKDKILIISDFESDRERKLFEVRYQVQGLCLNVPMNVIKEVLNKTSFQRLFFVIDKEYRLLFPTFIDSTDGTAKEKIEGLIKYLDLK